MDHEYNQELDKIIKQKEAEIEELKSAQRNKDSTLPPSQTKYRNVVLRNTILLVLIGLALFLPWGYLDGSARGYGGGYSVDHSSRSAASGFKLGLLTFTLPFLLVWIITFVFAFRNKVKGVAIAAVFGVLLCIWILALLANLGTSVSSSYGGFSSSVSTNFKATPLVFVPLIGYIILLFNFFIKKEVSDSEILLDLKQRDEDSETQRKKLLINLEENKKNLEESNKKHFYDESKLKRLLLIEGVLMLGLVCFLFLFAQFDVFTYLFAFIFVMFLILLSGIFIDTNIATLYKQLVGKAIIMGLAFISLICLMFAPNQNNPYDSTSLFPVILNFILSGTLLYLSLIQLASIKLNVHETGKENEIS